MNDDEKARRREERLAEKDAAAIRRAAWLSFKKDAIAAANEATDGMSRAELATFLPQLRRTLSEVEQSFLLLNLAIALRDDDEGAQHYFLAALEHATRSDSLSDWLVGRSAVAPTPSKDAA